eukprot:228158_1
MTVSESLDISETQGFSHQVAGHDGLLVTYDLPEAVSKLESGESEMECESVCESKTLRPSCRRLLKPVVGDERGAAELRFYERVFKEGRADTRLRRFLPEYFGCVEVRGKGKYMKMADLTSSFRRPCVVDIKIGRQTYDPTASAEKKAREEGKYPYMKELGFKICGMKTYDPTSRSAVKFDRSYGLTVTPETTSDAIGTFLNFRTDDSSTRSPQLTHCNNPRAKILNAFSERLGEIRSHMEIQEEFKFYCTSLLFVYDGEDLHASTMSENPKIGVYMIDFGHVFLSENPGCIDEGYLHGVRNLCDVFETTRQRFVATC